MKDLSMAAKVLIGTFSYFVLICSDVKSYILRALIDPNNYVLDDDLDDEIDGIWCGEQGKEIEYCVGN